MDWVRILAYVTGMVDQELLTRNEYLAAESRILKAQLKGRLQLSNAERATLAYVALKGDELATIDEIAERHRINRNHPVKVVFRLGELGYFDTMRGKGGGVRLAKDPAKINLGTLVRETEDDLVLVECFRDHDCQHVIEPACVLRKALHQALDAFLRTLDGYTIADLLKPSRSLARLLAIS